MIDDNISKEEIEDDKKKKNHPIYLKMGDFFEIFDSTLKNRGTFEVHSTSYTKRIKYGDTTYLFNETGRSDLNTLSLINKVKRDADKWLSKNPIPEFDEKDIQWFALTERPPDTIANKIDLRGAYWTYALNKKIISQKTDDFLNDNWEYNTVEWKQARLKALGSLATRRIIEYYVDGKQQTTLGMSGGMEPRRDIIINEESRTLYMYICNGIDQLMRIAVAEIPGAFYYYWDCIFASREATKDVIEFIKKAGYSVRTKEAKTSTLTINKKKYLITSTNEEVKIKNKIEKKEEEITYPIKAEESKFLYL